MVLQTAVHTCCTHLNLSTKQPLPLLLPIAIAVTQRPSQPLPSPSAVSLALSARLLLLSTARTIATPGGSGSPLYTLQPRWYL